MSEQLADILEEVNEQLMAARVEASELKAKLYEAQDELGRQDAEIIVLRYRLNRLLSQREQVLKILERPEYT